MRTGEAKNYYIWDQAKATDPKWTKPFPKFGKTLTTIDPMSQIMCMTGLFGPVGKGWRFKNTYTYTGRITDVGESFITVELADNVQIKVQRHAIASIMPKGTIKSA